MQKGTLPPTRTPNLACARPRVVHAPSSHSITKMNVMCAVWILIDWLRQIGVIRFNSRADIPNKGGLQVCVRVCKRETGH